MADYSFTAANVRLVSGLATPGVAGEAIDQGELVYLDPQTLTWLLATDDMPRAQTGIALSAVAAGQTLAIATQPGSIIDLGDFVLNEGDLLVASAANAGKLAPYSDLDVPSGDTLFIVGHANSQRQLVLRLSYTGVTAMALREGEAEITLDAISLVATGTVT